MANSIIGRQKETRLLNELYQSGKAELVAVYGRRRVGKTFLIDKTFGDRYDFYMTGIYEGSKTEQLANFTHQIEHYSGKKVRRPGSWMDAFFLLEEFLETRKANRRILVFIDELPWLDTPRSRFLKAFELFWNEWASKLDNMKLIVCGSATTWMTGKLLGDKGGLHNRVTQPIYLRPFDLGETELFLRSRGFAVSRRQVAEAYMSLGGTPYYLDMMRTSESIAQNIDRLFFSTDAPLRAEYAFLFRSLFRESALYRKVVECLSRKMKGMTRQELLAEARCEDTGYFSDVLSDLCNCDFIRRYSAFGKTERDMMYQLTDLYTLYYLRFVRPFTGGDEHYWSHRQTDIAPWQGYAFEQVCLHHIGQIKRSLGISGILSSVCTCSWQAFTDKDGKRYRGGQIDLILDRGDKTINLCEMKYVTGTYSIPADYADHMQARAEAFRVLTGTDKSLHLTMITADGTEHNEGWQRLQSEVTLDDLFAID